MEDNELEDRNIRRLEKKLGLKARARHRKTASNPSWLKEMGLESLVNFENDLKSGKYSMPSESDIIGTARIYKKVNNPDDIFGQKNESDVEKYSNDEESLYDEVEEPIVHENKTSTKENAKKNQIDGDEAQQDTTKVIRKLLNMISISEMPKVLEQACELFDEHPKAVLRKTLVNELLQLLANTAVSNKGSNYGWFQQELAAFVTSLAIMLNVFQKDLQFQAELVESLIIFVNVNEFQESLASYCIFLAYLYRFGLIGADLPLDIVEKFVSSKSIAFIRVARNILLSIGIFLRKDNFNRVQSISNLLNDFENSELAYRMEVEEILKILSLKKSAEQCIKKSEHLKKLIKTWTNKLDIKSINKLSLTLKDIESIPVKGRWWLVGSSYHPDESQVYKNSYKNNHSCDFRLDSQLTETAKILGFETEFRQRLFQCLVSTSGGPDTTAYALLKICCQQINGGSGSHAAAHKEREMIQLVLHCVMSEQPFNQFYPRIIGALLNEHHRFTIMVRCALWDVIADNESTTDAKTNLAHLACLLIRIFKFSIIFLKKYDFADESESNVIFLRQLFISLCTDMSSTQIHSLFNQFKDDAISRRFFKNLRIFLKKHLLKSPNLYNDITLKVINLVDFLVT